MKKTITLLCTLVICAAAFAQHGHDSYDDYPAKYTRPGYPDHGYTTDFLIRQRNETIAKINFGYDARIHSVRHSRARLHEKKRAIARLEKERKDRIKMAYAFYDLKNKRNHPYRQQGSYAIH
ncbi:MAG TPA: hypothetical protein VFV68_08770 [Agriterribacter sp.]|nr:hypothetical protein [Agriterribacter sp.]